MLTDTFHDRYASRAIWTDFTDADRRLQVQLYRIISEQLFPPFNSDGSKNDTNMKVWKRLDSQLSMELGEEHLYNLPSGVHLHTPEQICKNFVCAKYDAAGPSADVFMKQRVSFVELAFREKASDNALKASGTNRQLEELMGALDGGSMRLSGDPAAGRLARTEARENAFNQTIAELNARFATAGKPLNYHNGFVQIAADQLSEAVIETPFWGIVSEAKWSNVDTDIKEAIDRRDTGGRDPALYAAKALESVLKILSDDLGVTTGRENGAHAYLDNLGSARGNHYITEWEKSFLKQYFSSIRNPLGHGPGNGEMLKLTEQQETWAIEFAMSWTKSLVRRQTVRSP